MKTNASRRTNRRHFLQAAAGSSLGVIAGKSVSAAHAADIDGDKNASKPDSDSPAMPAASGVATKFWIDPSIAAWRPTPWRKVHIEYHTSRHMPNLADKFNADEFGDRLLAAHVNGATV